MTQDDMPAPAVVDEEKAVVEEEESPLVEYVPPSPPRPEPKLAKPAPATPSKPAPRDNAAADPFAVGIRVLKMAPAWLLFAAACCSVLVLLLGWVRSSGEVEAVTLPTKHNDARSARPTPAAEETRAQAEAVAPATASTASPSTQKSTAANDAPPQAVAQAQAPQTAPPAAPKTDEKARVETPAQQGDAGGKFTAQVGSHSDQSEANEQVSRLRAAGFDARSVAADLPGRGTWYRVQVGRFAERGEAAKTVATLRSKGAASSALVVPVQH